MLQFLIFVINIVRYFLLTKNLFVNNKTMCFFLRFRSVKMFKNGLKYVKIRVSSFEMLFQFFVYDVSLPNEKRNYSDLKIGQLLIRYLAYLMARSQPTAF